MFPSFPWALNKGVLIYKPLENFWLNRKRIIQLQAQLPQLLLVTTKSKLMYVLKGRQKIQQSNVTI